MTQQSAVAMQGYGVAVRRGYDLWRETAERAFTTWTGVVRRTQTAQLQFFAAAGESALQTPARLFGALAEQARYAAALQTPATQRSLEDLRGQLSELSSQVTQQAGRTDERLTQLATIEQQVQELAAVAGLLPTRLTAIEGEVASLRGVSQQLSAIEQQFSHAGLGDLGQQLEQLDLAGLRHDLDERLSRLEAAIVAQQNGAVEQGAKAPAARSTARSASRSGRSGGDNSAG